MVKFRKIPFFAKIVEKVSPYTFITKNSLHYMESINYQHMRNHIDSPFNRDKNPDHYTSTFARASLPMPYLDTPTGSKVPLWRLHPHRMFEMAENIGDCRVVFEAIIREVFRNSIEIKPKFKYKCPRCLKEYTERPAKEYIPMNDAIAKANEGMAGQQQMSPVGGGKPPGNGPPGKDGPPGKNGPPQKQPNPVKKAEDNDENGPDKSQNEEKKSLEGQDSTPNENIDEDDNPFDSGDEEDSETEEENITFECSECGLIAPEKKFIKPDPKQRRILKRLSETPINNNNMNIVDVARQFERDLNTVDSAYILLLREYKIRHGTGVIDPDTGATGVVDDPENAKIEEIVRVPSGPDYHDGQRRGKAWGNVGKPGGLDMPKIRPSGQDSQQPSLRQVRNTGVLRQLRRQTRFRLDSPSQSQRGDTMQSTSSSGRPASFHPDLLYGNSPLNAIWKKIMSLYHQDEYIWKYFDKDRPPKSILAIGSRNFEDGRVVL